MTAAQNFSLSYERYPRLVYIYKCTPMSPMKLTIPTPGQRSRARPHSPTTPRPLLPVAGTMIVERIVETFARTLDRPITEIVYILGPDFGSEIKNTLRE